MDYGFPEIFQVSIFAKKVAENAISPGNTDQSIHTFWMYIIITRKLPCRAFSLKNIDMRKCWQIS